MRVRLLVLLVGCGPSCSSGVNAVDGAAPHDLAGVDLAVGDLGSSPIDLASVDLPRRLYPLDLAGVDQLAFGGFCAGTLVAGTCLQSFFGPLSTCFVASGPCSQSVPGVLSPTRCWSSGAEFKQVSGLSVVNRTFIFGDVICFTEQIGGSGPVKTPWFASGGNGMFFDPSTGNYDCPDSSRGNVGTNYGGCAALQALLAPDTTGCMPGTCP